MLESRPGGGGGVGRPCGRGRVRVGGAPATTGAGRSVRSIRGRHFGLRAAGDGQQATGGWQLASGGEGGDPPEVECAHRGHGGGLQAGPIG